MKILDTNLLLYAVDANSEHHGLARRELEAALNAPVGVGFVWLVLIGFLRLATHRRIMPQPLSLDEALALLEGWLGHPNARVVAPGPRHAGILGRLLLSIGRAGDLANDAHIAALAIEHGGEVLTFDRDFSRFAGLQVQVLG